MYITIWNVIWDILQIACVVIVGVEIVLFGLAMIVQKIDDKGK
jgi:hypothetical protein